MLLVVVAIVMAIGYLTTVARGPFSPIKTLFNGILQASLLAALLALWKGRLRDASLIYLAGTWLWATLAIIALGGIRNNALMLYGTLPVSAAWLLGYRASLVTAGACIGTMLVIAICEKFGLLPARVQPRY